MEHKTRHPREMAASKQFAVWVGAGRAQPNLAVNLEITAVIVGVNAGATHGWPDPYDPAFPSPGASTSGGRIFCKADFALHSTPLLHGGRA